MFSGSDSVWFLPVALAGALTVSLALVAVMLLRLRLAQKHIRDKEIEQRGVLDRLKDNENRLRAIIESEPGGVMLLSADGTVLEINPAGLRLVGADRPEDVIGNKIYSAIAPEYIETHRENMRRVFSGGTAIYEFKAITLKGRSVWMETHGVPLRDSRGTIYAMLGITRDITEHKQTEDQTRRHQTELARVARLSTMGEMATGIAHELNQPLSAIANFSRGCIRRLRTDGMTPGELIEPLEEVCEQAERAGEILRHVRDFVRKSELEMKPLDINQTVRTVVKFTEHEARQQGAIVRLNLDAELPLVKADAIMIEQVICNLVRNAVEAMAEAQSPRREVTILTRRISGNIVEIEVVDSGPGIDGALIDQVFDQFFTTKPDGVGMGLSISRSIVESHGGRIRAESGRLGGTTFRFTLQVSEQQARRHERTDSLHC